MIGRQEVKAAKIMELAASVGTELTPAQAARKLQTWERVKVVERTGRGLYAFTDTGRHRYELDQQQEADHMDTT